MEQTDTQTDAAAPGTAEDIAALRERCAAAEAALAARMEDIAILGLEIAALTEDRAQQDAALLKAKKALAKQKRAAARREQAYLKSTSWRITAPLRATMRLLSAKGVRQTKATKEAPETSPDVPVRCPKCRAYL